MSYRILRGSFFFFFFAEEESKQRQSLNMDEIGDFVKAQYLKIGNFVPQVMLVVNSVSRG